MTKVLTDVNKLPDETETQYIYRLGELHDNGLIDLTWSELAEIINKNCREDGESYTESAYRKRYANMRKFNAECVFDKDDETLVELEELKKEIQKEKKKLFDQRREYNKLLASDARAEHLNDCLVTVAKQMNENYPLLPVVKPVYKDGLREAVCCFADWHYGMVTNNIWNTYNVDICQQRIAKCVSYMMEYLMLHQVQTLRVVMLGDLANGGIRTSCRVASEEDVCDQLMHVSEIMAQAIERLSSVVNTVLVYSNYGNHMRTIQNKEDSIHSDNMEKIIPWWLEQRFQNRKDISIVYSQFKEFTLFDVLGKKIVTVHGDGFKFKDIGVTTNMLFTKLFGCPIDYTISGDKHHLEEVSNYGIESILVRSLCGCDNYANDQHLYDKPGQTLIIFNNDYGRECTYHIPLE